MFEELKKGDISGWLKSSNDNQPNKKDMPPANKSTSHNYYKSFGGGGFYHLDLIGCSYRYFF